MSDVDPGCAEVEESLGALLLGGLDAADRSAVERHVAACPSCAAALAELAPVVGLLHRVDDPAAALAGPPPELLDRVVAAGRAGLSEVPGAPDPADPADELAAARRRRRGLLAVAAAAAVVLLVGGAVLLRPHSAGEGPPVMASASDPATRVSATVEMLPVDVGTQVDLRLTGVAPGQRCSLVAVSRSGEREVASSWVAEYDGEAGVVGTTSLPVADIARFEITVPDGRSLLSIPV